MQQHKWNNALLCALSIFLLIAVTWAYLPGLKGNFLFDDFSNLPALGETGPVDNWQTFWRYITSGTADPTGRPLALLTFLIDANNWPADPYPFKRTSLILHLLNAALLGALLLRLGRFLRTESADSNLQIRLSALIGTGLWAIHPLFVSTTLYIVQREAMLPATFVLLGLHLWITGRSKLQRGATRQALAWMFLGIPVCTALAILSKANGILLPILVLIVDRTVICRADIAHNWSMAQTRAFRLTSVLLLGIPSIAVFAYLAARIPSALEYTPRYRPWTWEQRMLTEPRILLEYLSLLFVPRPFTTGLYNDNVVVATGWVTPWNTFPAIVLTLILPIAAWLKRGKHPLMAAGILFFFAGHLLESTVIPLELYFEHRNYLPALLLFWPIAWWLSQSEKRFYRLVLASTIMAGMSLMTHARSDLWGNDQEQALVWAALNPNSPRAQATAALHEMHMGRADLARQRLEKAIQTLPDEIQIAFNLIAASCELDGVRPSDIQAAHEALRAAKHGRDLTFKWLDDMMSTAASSKCRGFTFSEMEALIETARNNKRLHSNAGRLQEFLHIEGRIAIAQGKPDAALEKFNLALTQQVRPAAALRQAALLGMAAYPSHGLKHLHHYEMIKSRTVEPKPTMAKVHQLVLKHQRYWENEVSTLRNALLKDAKARGQCESAC